MPTASVYGANYEVNSLAYGNNPAYQAALNLAAQINQGVLKGSINPQSDNTAPTVSGGVYEYVRTQPGSVKLPDYYGVTVINASNVTIVLGDGSDKVSLGRANQGNWNITTGDGNDKIFANNKGDDTIAAGKGNDLIGLGSGRYDIQLQGGNTSISGGNSGLFSFLHNSVLGIASTTGGNASLFGSLLTNIEARLGNVTLGGPTQNSDTVIDVAKGVATGGHDYITNIPGGVTVNLSGYDPTQANYAITHPMVQGGQTTVTLNDQTSLTFDNATFKASKFTLS
jgi:Ca2+-binding RTX toxin-like protein